MDPYEGQKSDPLTLHKYAYCEASPVGKIDPLGFRIVVLGNDDEKAGYDEAIKYLMGSGVKIVKTILDRLNNSSVTYTIQLFDSGVHIYGSSQLDYRNSFDTNGTTIYWSPWMGQAWTGADGQETRLSPAIDLIHELGHAYHWDVNPSRYSRNVAMPIDDYDNKEEEMTIILIENPVAKALGEVERKTHQTLPYHSEGPISTQHYRLKWKSGIDSLGDLNIQVALAL